MKIYDAANTILGRLGTQVAKDALLGEEVQVINCDKAIVSGKKTDIFKNEKERRARKGYPLKSAKMPRLADRYVRRSIRGMLPWDKTRGREAYKRIMCHVGVPEELAGKDAIVVKDGQVSKLPTLKYITVEQLMKQLGKEVKQA